MPRRLSLTHLAAAVLVAALLPFGAVAQGIHEQILFDGATDKSYYSFRIPSLVAFKSKRDGAHVALAFAEARKRCGRDSGDIDTVFRISRDGGNTWSKRRLLAGRRELSNPDVGDKGTWGNPTSVYDKDTGKIWLMLNYNRADRAQFPCKNMCSAKRARQCQAKGLERPIGVGDRRVFVTHSANEGKSWSKPIDITDKVQLENTKWDAVGPGNGIQLERECSAGALVFPAIGRNIYSVDHGKTWSTTQRLPGGTSEATIVELSDGQLVRNDRPVARHLVDMQTRPVSISSDCGATWSEWQGQPELTTTRVHASMIRLSANWGDTLVFANPSSTRNRRSMTLRLSEDGGQTWSASKVVHDGVAAYSSLAELPDGRLGLLYEKGPNGHKKKGAIALFRAPVQWLASGRQRGLAQNQPVRRTQPATNRSDQSNSGSSWSNPDTGGSPKHYDRNNIQDLPWLKN